MRLQWWSDGTTEVEEGLEMPVEDPSVRAEGDNRRLNGRKKNQTIQHSAHGLDHHTTFLLWCNRLLTRLHQLVLSLEGKKCNAALLCGPLSKIQGLPKARTNSCSFCHSQIPRLIFYSRNQHPWPIQSILPPDPVMEQIATFCLPFPPTNCLLPTHSITLKHLCP
jgi:hypothetical protein